MQRRALTVALAVLSLAACAQAADWIELHGILSGREAFVRSPQQSWLEGGFGRLDVGGNDHVTLATAQIGVDLKPVHWLDLHAHGIARAEPSSYGGEHAGITEAYVDVIPVDNVWNRFRLRAGMYFLPTSRENVDELWFSPYTMTLSAINSWIGQEFRPIGAEAEYRHTFASGNRITVGAGSLRGNDTTGTLLGWRGFALGSRLTVYRETLPLPPLFSLRDPSLFGGKQMAGTIPFSHDLDGRTGWTARARLSSEKYSLQIARADNRADRRFYNGQYSWITPFWLVSGDYHITENTIVAAEGMYGSTGMGFDPVYVQAGFASEYLLVSHRIGPHRFSIRGDTFRMSNRDDSPAEDNSERGHAITAAYFYETARRIRYGLEYVRVTGRRPAAVQSGFNGDAGGRTVTAEILWRF